MSCQSSLDSLFLVTLRVSLLFQIFLPIWVWSIDLTRFWNKLSAWSNYRKNLLGLSCYLLLACLIISVSIAKVFSSTRVLFYWFEVKKLLSSFTVWLSLNQRAHSIFLLLFPTWCPKSTKRPDYIQICSGSPTLNKGTLYLRFEPETFG